MPAVLAGTDVGAILDGAEIAAKNCESPRAESNRGLWADQLVAESTGKRGRGILRVADEPAAIPARTAPIGFFVFCATPAGATPGTTRFVAALAEHGQPRGDD